MLLLVPWLMKRLESNASQPGTTQTEEAAVYCLPKDGNDNVAMGRASEASMSFVHREEVWKQWKGNLACTVHGTVLLWLIRQPDELWHTLISGFL